MFTSLDLSMNEHIAAFFLIFGDLFTMLIVGLAVFAITKRRLLYHAICLTAFTLILNVALKGTFKIPLAAFLGSSGYAFPSGHMQSATTFYVWLACHQTHVFFRILIAVILIGVGASLIHYHYHTLSDVLAGFACGIFLTIFYHFFLIKYPVKLFYFLLITSSLLMVYNALIYVSLPYFTLATYLILLLLLLFRWKKDYFMPNQSLINAC